VVGAATAVDATVRYSRMVGDHVVQGATIAHVWGRAPIDTDTALTVADAGLRIGFERTFEQDTAFGIRQLVDIALRAMSPAINDPYTAEQSVYHVAAVLCDAINGNLGPQIWRDGSGTPRVLVPNHDLSDHLDLACGQLRRVASHEPRVVAALLGMLAEVATRADTDAHHEAIRVEARLLMADARRGIVQPADLALVDAAYGAIAERHTGSEEELGDGVDGEAGEAADHRSVDADELEVASDLELDASTGLGGIPPLDGRRDQFGDLSLVVLGNVEHEPFDPTIDLGAQLVVHAEATAGRREPVDEPAA
jgi:hypothetical protein